MYNQFQSRIIIIGASGLIGSHLSSELVRNKIKTIPTCFSKNLKDMVKFDFTKDELVNIIDSPNEQDIFVILAAAGNPNWIANNKDEAYMINVEATKNLINQISKFKSKIYFMSSVEVFDGTQESLLESSKPNPLNYYGETKLIIENYLEANYSNYHVIRTGWNTGINLSSRCVIKMTYETLLKENARMATDNSFTITHVEDLASSLAKIIFTNKRKIIHLCCPEIITRNELADKIISQSKKKNKMNYKKCLFSEIIYSEPRSRLNNLKTQYKELFQLKFRKIEDTIIQKVLFLDSV